MKYPIEQFNELKQALTILNTEFELNSIDENSLHFMVYKQYSEGHSHNHLYTNGSDLKNKFVLSETDFKEYRKMIDRDFDFKLYPEGCNEKHIVTAVKQALKEIN